MRRRVIVCSAIAAVGLLSACGQNSEPVSPPQSSASAPASSEIAPTTSSTLPVPTGVSSPGIVMATCSPGNLSMTVSNYQSDGLDALKSQIAWTEANEPIDATIASCAKMHQWPYGFYSGQRIRSAFNKDFSAIYVAHRDPSNGSIAIGAMDNQVIYTPLSPSNSSEFTKQKDADPRYHAATNRVYYWNLAADPPHLMSCRTDGTDTNAETALEQQYKYSYNTPLYIPNTRELMFRPLDEDIVYNAAGTLGAEVFDSKLTLAAPDKIANNPAPIKLTGIKFSGKPHAAALADDTTVILNDDYQIYRAKVAGGSVTVTTLLKNDSLKIDEVTLSQDGRSIAFLGENPSKVGLYTISADGSGTAPRNLVNFDAKTKAAILEFRS